MNSNEIDLAIKYHNRQIELSKLALEKLFVLRSIEQEKNNNQISFDLD